MGASGSHEITGSNLFPVSLMWLLVGFSSLWCVGLRTSVPHGLLTGGLSIGSTQHSNCLSLESIIEQEGALEGALEAALLGRLGGSGG